MAVLGRSELSSTEQDKNSVDHLFETLKNLNDTKHKADQAKLEHLDKVNTLNLDTMNKYVQGEGVLQILDPVTNSFRKPTYTEQMDADHAKMGLEVSRKKQMQEMADLASAMDKGSAGAPTPGPNPQVATAAGLPVMQADTAKGVPGMEPVSNKSPDLPAPADSSRMRTTMTLDSKGKPSMSISRTEPNPVAEQMARERMDLAQEKEQEALKKTYTDRLTKVMSYRSGGLGTQDAKVNQAIDLRVLADQYYDPKTGDYNVPPAQHSELILGLARLLSPSGQISYEQTQDLKAKTLREGIAKTAISLGMDPVEMGGPTQSVVKMILDSIDRQGLTSEKLRGTYMEGAKKYASNKIKDRAEVNRLSNIQITNSFADYLKTSEASRGKGKNSLSFAGDEETAYQAWKAGQK